MEMRSLDPLPSCTFKVVPPNLVSRPIFLRVVLLPSTNDAQHMPYLPLDPGLACEEGEGNWPPAVLTLNLSL